ncbi:MFS transporter [Kocuria marina]|uniref:MFS transporter n=1 Tax=Kocuria marina TaxID=223184 RepID=UPI003460C503
MSTTVTGDPAGPTPRTLHQSFKQQRKSMLAVVCGNFLEWFDWTIYALLATYLAANFFNQNDPQSALLSTLAVFAGGFLARPLGGLVFGRVADKFGRKASLIACMLLMGTGSLLIAVLPTYGTIGVWASLLLFLARFTQGLAHGGESGTAFTYLAEIAPANKRGLWGSAIMMTMLLGVMAATALSILLTTVFTEEEMISYGWRVGFAVGAVLAIFALYLRRSAAESGFFEEAKAAAGTAAARVITRRQLIIIAARILALSLLTNVLYYTWVNFASSFAISGKGMDPNGAYIATFGAQLLAFVALPFWGRLSDRIGRRKQLNLWAIAVIVVVFPMNWILTAEPWTLFVSQGLALLVWGIQSSIHSTIMSEQSPTEARATSVGIWTSVGAALSGGTAPYLYTWLNSMDMGWVFSAYIIVLAVVTLIAVRFIPETAGIEMDRIPLPGEGTAPATPTTKH